MRNKTVARRYAKALFELAAENKSLDDVLLGLSNLRHSFKNAPEMHRVLLNPLVKPEAKRDLVRIVTSNTLILKMVELLARRKRLDLLEAVHDELEQMAEQAKGIRRVLVRTALPLTEEQKRSVESTLAKSLGGKISGRYEVEKDLIGGIWVKMGDKLLDATLRGRVNDFRHALLHSAN